jgi:hypothetical protein
MTITEVPSVMCMPLEQIKVKTTDAELFERRSGSSVVKMYSRNLKVEALKNT